MTTCYSEFLSDEQIVSLLVAMEEAAFYSRRDHCRVVLVRCAQCASSFEEELGAAKDRTRERRDFKCLKCDPEAEKYAFTGVTVRFGWRF